MKVGVGVNKQIYSLRKKSHLTQQEMAKRCNVSLRQYQRIESNKAMPNVKTAIRLAQVLKTTVEELFE